MVNGALRESAIVLEHHHLADVVIVELDLEWWHSIDGDGGVDCEVISLVSGDGGVVG